jgi:hypothetical protein
MRLKIIALICLLTIAVPVEADAPVITPIPGDTADANNWRALTDNLGSPVMLCKQDISLPPDHDNLVALAQFAARAPSEMIVSDESTLELRTMESTFGGSGIRLTFHWSVADIRC